MATGMNRNAKRTVSPLTPALSPLRGEGDPGAGSWQQRAILLKLCRFLRNRVSREGRRITGVGGCKISARTSIAKKLGSDNNSSGRMWAMGNRDRNRVIGIEIQAGNPAGC